MMRIIQFTTEMCFITHEHLWINCQIELSTSLCDGSSMFQVGLNSSRLPLQNHYSYTQIP